MGFCSLCQVDKVQRSDPNATNHHAVLAKEGKELAAQAQKPVTVAEVSRREYLERAVKEANDGVQRVVVPKEVGRLIESLMKMARCASNNDPQTPLRSVPVSDLEDPSESSPRTPVPVNTRSRLGKSSPSKPPTYPLSAPATPSTPISKLASQVRNSESGPMNEYLTEALREVLGLLKYDVTSGHSGVTLEYLRERGGDCLYNLAVKLGNALFPFKQYSGRKRAGGSSDEQTMQVRLALKKLADEGVIQMLQLEMTDEAAEYLLKQKLLGKLLNVETVSLFKQRSEKELYPAIGALLLEVLQLDPRRDRKIATMASLNEADSALGEQDVSGDVAQSTRAEAEGPLLPSSAPESMEPIGASEDPEGVVSAVVELLLWHEGYVSSSFSRGPVEYLVARESDERLEGCVEAKVSREKLAEAIMQVLTELVAVISINEQRKLYKEGEEHTAWNILTCLETSLGFRATLVDNTPGDMQLRLEVGGPFRLYNLETGELHPEAEEFGKMLVQLMVSNMAKASPEEWEVASKSAKDYLQVYLDSKLRAREEKIEQESAPKKLRIVTQQLEEERAEKEKEKAEKERQIALNAKLTSELEKFKAMMILKAT